MNSAILERMEQIESRLAYQEQSIETLSDLVYAQSQQLAELNAQHRDLKQKFQGLADFQVDGDVDDERPPHY